MNNKNIAIDLFNYQTQKYDLQKSQKSDKKEVKKTSLTKILRKSKKEKVKILTLEEIKENEFNYLLEKNLQNFHGDIDSAIKWTSLDCAVIKPNSLINYKLPYERNYNSKSLENLVNQTVDETKQATYLEIKKKEKINNVNKWANEFKKQYTKETGRTYTGLLSKQTSAKILKISSCFTRSVLSKYNNLLGFNQRILSFATFTITENQKHSDEIITKNFIDFIDHLKKVKNYIIDPVTKERTKQEGLKIQNYVWRAETQENGNIHFHLIADCFLNQDMLRRVWNGYLKKMGYKYGYGSANIQSLKKDGKGNKIKDVENYLCKYMTKQPLKNKYKYMKKQELENISDDEKYRRPVIGKSWGCSKALLSLEYPVFYQGEAKRVLKEFKGKLKQIVSENIPEYIKVFKGKIKETLKTCTYDLQRAVKSHFKILFMHLYPKPKLTPQLT